ncbi:MAG: DUF1043 family protein [Gammaproteobacteria bacterium]|nr:DUF1043 family protein [Gammaproteobacteria bacterium]
MDLFGNDLFFWLVILLLGLAIGFVVGRNNNTDMKMQNQLTEQLAAAQSELAEYKEKVALHFADTAAVVNDMTDSYRKVHAELSKGAKLLCDDPETVENLLALDSYSQQRVVAEQEPQVMVRPPMDYAPKTPDSEHGTLDERYGLREDQENIDRPQYDIPVKPGGLS